MDSNSHAETPTMGSVVKVTPEYAAELLATINTRNRPVSLPYVKSLAEQMQDGNWRQAFDPIRISKTNVLLDGQHRLSAIVKSGITQDLLIIEGLEDDLFHVIDTGRMRMASDILNMDGQPNARSIASLARMIINYQLGAYGNTLTNVGRATESYRYITHEQILAFTKSEDLQPHFLAGKKLYTKFKAFSANEWAFFYYILCQAKEDQAYIFLDSLATGENLQPKSAIFLLRKRIINASIGKRYNATAKERLGLVITTWNLYRQGKAVQFVSYDTKTEMPTPI